MGDKVSEKEILEFMAIAYELCAKYGIDPSLVTRESAIEQILKDRPIRRRTRRYMRAMGKALSKKRDKVILEVLRVSNDCK